MSAAIFLRGSVCCSGAAAAAPLVAPPLKENAPPETGLCEVADGLSAVAGCSLAFLAASSFRLSSSSCFCFFTISRRFSSSFSFSSRSSCSLLSLSLSSSACCFFAISWLSIFRSFSRIFLATASVFSQATTAFSNALSPSLFSLIFSCSSTSSPKRCSFISCFLAFASSTQASSCAVQYSISPMLFRRPFFSPAPINRSSSPCAWLQHRSNPSMHRSTALLPCSSALSASSLSKSFAFSCWS
mmetsp:Transcript_15644/g.61127  ORF Transcript_15644/g.61127 Transcript_15644/m.61127 type:complete len:243 (-) Transcript_15644:242-970(-)